MVFAVFLIPFSRKPFKSYTKIIVNYSKCTIRLLFPAAAKTQKIAVLNTYERVFCRFTFFAVLYNSYLRPYLHVGRSEVTLGEAQVVNGVQYVCLAGAVGACQGVYLR